VAIPDLVVDIPKPRRTRKPVGPPKIVGAAAPLPGYAQASRRIYEFEKSAVTKPANSRCYW
jgi:hypothetical protein